MRIFLLVLVANTVLNVEELVLLVECSTCDQEGDTEDDAVLDSVVEQFRSHVRQVGQEPERAVHIICVSRLLTNPSGVAREEQSHCDPDGSDCAEDQVDEPDLILRLLLDHRDALPSKVIAILVQLGPVVEADVWSGHDMARP